MLCVKEMQLFSTTGWALLCKTGVAQACAHDSVIYSVSGVLLSWKRGFLQKPIWFENLRTELVLPSRAPLFKELAEIFPLETAGKR